jgi:hypothetical protein
MLHILGHEVPLSSAQVEIVINGLTAAQELLIRPPAGQITRPASAGAKHQGCICAPLPRTELIGDQYVCHPKCPVHKGQLWTTTG